MTHLLSNTEVVEAINRDIISINNKKKLLINNNDIPMEERARTLRHYNNMIVDLEHGMSTLFN